MTVDPHTLNKWALMFDFPSIDFSFPTVINAGVAGCCTGLALSIPGTPCLLSLPPFYNGLKKHLILHPSTLLCFKGFSVLLS